ncbi:MAG TPA: hypothetical protein VFD82_24240 [Planctomycetota bacterium]|nr:hypothetical protein [Planctomycetota bacterium]
MAETCYTLCQLFSHFLCPGCPGSLGFGGPIALVTLGLLTRLSEVPEPLWILGAGLADLWT